MKRLFNYLLASMAVLIAGLLYWSAMIGDFISMGITLLMLLCLVVVVVKWIDWVVR